MSDDDTPRMLRKKPRYTPKGAIPIVVLASGSSLEGTLLDESSHGIAALLSDVSEISIGRKVRVRLRGQRHEAVIRDISEFESGYRVGLQLASVK